jgi:hypothetical protein
LHDDFAHGTILIDKRAFGELNPPALASCAICAIPDVTAGGACPEHSRRYRRTLTVVLGCFLPWPP